MRSKLLLIIIFVVFSLNSFAQQTTGTISGVLKTEGDKKPLVNGIVSLSNKQTNKTVAIRLTSKEGTFSISEVPNGVFFLQVEYTGHAIWKSDSIVINENNRQINLPEILLSPVTKTLQNVSVTATKSFISQTANKITLNIGQSPVAAGNTVYDVLLMAPGVLADEKGNITAKGKTVAVYMDGRPSYVTGEELKNLLTNMPAQSVEKIDIITNPSAKYDAAGGVVIDIKTTKNKKFGTNGTVTAGVGTGRFLRYNSGVSINHRKNKLSLNSGFDYMHNAQYYDNQSTRYIADGSVITEDEYETRQRNNYSFRLGIDYDINKTTTAGFLAKGFMNFRDREVENNAMTNKLLPLSDSSSIVSTKGYARFASPSLNMYFKKVLDTTGKEITVNADYLRYLKKWNDDFSTDFYDGNKTKYRSAELLRDFSPADNEIKSISVDYVHPLKKNAKLEAGLKTIFSKTDNDVLWQNYTVNTWVNDLVKTNHFIYEENILAAYINYSKTIKKLSVETGLRAEQTFTTGTSLTLNTAVKNEYLNFFPNIGFSYEASKKHQWGLNYRKSIERYGFDFVNPFIVYQSQYTYSQGNPYLLPQIDHNFEISHSYNYQLFSSVSYTHSVKALAPVYKQDAVTNLLVSSYDNLGTSDMLVAIVTLNKVFFKKWTSVNSLGGFYINYDIRGVNTKNQNRRVTGYFTTNNTIAFKKFTAELRGVYRSPFASGIFRMNSFINAAAGLSKPVFKNKATLKLNVSDLFNTQIFENTVTDFQQVNGVFTNKPETRFVNLVLTWKFGNKNVKAVKVRKTGIESEKGRMGVE